MKKIVITNFARTWIAILVTFGLLSVVLYLINDSKLYRAFPVVIILLIIFRVFHSER